MAGSRIFLQNASTRHAVYVNRFTGSQMKTLKPYLLRVRQTVLTQLSTTSLTQASREQLIATLKGLDGALKGIYDEMSVALLNNMKEFSQYEAEFSTRMFSKAVSVDFKTPSKTLINAAVLSKPLLLTDKALTVSSSLRKYSAKKRREITRVIKDGVIKGVPDAQIASQLAGTISKTHTGQLFSLVRTITNHVSSAARDAVVDNNSDIVDGVEWISVLDGKTTDTCAALDGQIFDENSGPRPPAHFGCRSTVVPHIKDKYNISHDIESERPAIGSDGVETVSGRTDYQSWLKKQPASFQEEVLGVQKAKLFRNGGLSLDRFVDHNYQPLTLEQLKGKEPEAFKKAGL